MVNAERKYFAPVYAQNLSYIVDNVSEDSCHPEKQTGSHEKLFVYLCKNGRKIGALPIYHDAWEQHLF